MTWTNETAAKELRRTHCASDVLDSIATHLESLPASGWVEVNMNDTAQVELTDEGQRIWDRHFDYLQLPRRPFKNDLPLWEIMQIFGSVCYMGGSRPFATNIRLKSNLPPPLSEPRRIAQIADVDEREAAIAEIVKVRDDLARIAEKYAAAIEKSLKADAIKQAMNDLSPTPEPAVIGWACVCDGTPQIRWAMPNIIFPTRKEAVAYSTSHQDGNTSKPGVAVRMVRMPMVPTDLTAVHPADRHHFERGGGK